MDHRTVEESAGREREFEDLISAGQPVMVGPVSLGSGPLDGRPGQPDGPADRHRELHVNVGLIGGEGVAVRKGDTGWRKILSVVRRTGIRGSKVEEVRPPPRILGTGNL